MPPLPPGLVEQKNHEGWVHLGGGSDSPWTFPVDLVFSTYLGTQIFLYKEKDGELIFFASLGKDLFCLAMLEHIFAVFKNFPPCIFSFAPLFCLFFSDLSQNRLTSLPADVFKKLKNIKIL